MEYSRQANSLGRPGECIARMIAHPAHSCPRRSEAPFFRLLRTLPRLLRNGDRPFAEVRGRSIELDRRLKCSRGKKSFILSMNFTLPASAATVKRWVVIGPRAPKLPHRRWVSDLLAKVPLTAEQPMQAISKLIEQFRFSGSAQDRCGGRGQSRRSALGTDRHRRRQAAGNDELFNLIMLTITARSRASCSSPTPRWCGI